VSKSPHFYDGFWRNFPLVQTCVYAAFGCSSTWCVRSRAIHALLGAPTPLLQDVVNKVLMRHVAKGQPPCQLSATRGASCSTLRCTSARARGHREQEARGGRGEEGADQHRVRQGRQGQRAGQPVPQELPVGLPGRHSAAAGGLKGEPQGGGGKQ